MRGRFTHWAMASMVGAFFKRGGGEQEGAEETMSVKQAKEKKLQAEKREKAKERRGMEVWMDSSRNRKRIQFFRDC